MPRLLLAIAVCMPLLLGGCVSDYVTHHGIPPWIQMPAKPFIENLF